jgi:hypothetical protein
MSVDQSKGDGGRCLPWAFGKVEGDEVLSPDFKACHVLPHGRAPPLQDEVKTAACSSVETAPRPIARLRNDHTAGGSAPAGRSPKINKRGGVPGEGGGGDASLYGITA